MDQEWQSWNVHSVVCFMYIFLYAAFKNDMFCDKWIHFMHFLVPLVPYHNIKFPVYWIVTCLKHKSPFRKSAFAGKFDCGGRFKYSLHRPVASISCLQNHAQYAVMKIMHSLLSWKSCAVCCLENHAQSAVMKIMHSLLSWKSCGLLSWKSCTVCCHENHVQSAVMKIMCSLLSWKSCTVCCHENHAQSAVLKIMYSLLSWKSCTVCCHENNQQSATCSRIYGE
jgi:hypothetical protein